MRILVAVALLLASCTNAAAPSVPTTPTTTPQATARPTQSPDPAAGLRRPWTRPKLAPGADCPVTKLRRRPDPRFAPIQGDGPVGPALPGSGTLGYTVGPQLTDASWGVAKVLWAVDGAVRGPVLVRGRQLDGPHELYFEDPATPELLLPYHRAGRPWRDYPSYTRLRAPGCYAYQIDTRSRSFTIVFRAAGPRIPPASCPVTVGSPGAAPPSPIDPRTRPVSWVANWYGNAALWVRLAPYGIVPAQRNGPELGTKFPWWRTLSGRLTISGQRLDGPSRGFRSEIPDGYGDSGFQATGLIWPAPGCWRVTGSVAGRSLSIVVWVAVIG